MRVFEDATLLYEIDARCIPHDHYKALLDIAFKEVSDRQINEACLFFEPEIGRDMDGELNTFSFTVHQDDELFENLLRGLEHRELGSRELVYILMSLHHRAQDIGRLDERGQQLHFKPDTFRVRMSPSSASSHDLSLLWDPWANQG